MADPGFPRGGSANPTGGRQPIIWQISPENCMKMKNFLGKREWVPRAPLRSAIEGCEKCQRISCVNLLQQTWFYQKTRSHWYLWSTGRCGLQCKESRSQSHHHLPFLFLPTSGGDPSLPADMTTTINIEYFNS